MKERYNSYLPLWFLLVMPPLVLILLCFNFIMSAVGLLISLFMLGTPDAFTKYSKNVFKVFGRVEKRGSEYQLIVNNMEKL